MILDATTAKITARMGAAVDTTAPEFVVDYADHTATTFAPGQQNGALSGTSNVDICSAPAASTQRQIKYISIHNNDAVTQRFIVEFDDNSTKRTLVSALVRPSASLEWSA